MAAAAALAAAAGAAWADDDDCKNASYQTALTQNWGGFRDTLCSLGIMPSATSTDEVLGNPMGGVRQGVIYEGQLDLLLDIDLSKRLLADTGWTGLTFHANAFQIHGRGLTTNDVGNLLTLSNTEAERATRLDTLWLQQNFWSDALSFRAGRLAADDEFVKSQYAQLFISSTFGWPGILGIDLPSGGAAYPLATPGLRVAYKDSDEVTLRAEFLNGNPAGPGLAGDPQMRDASGTGLDLSHTGFVIAEGAYAQQLDKDEMGRPLGIKLGLWYHTGRFADLRYDQNGLSLANPASTGIPELHSDDYGFYAIYDQQITKVKGSDTDGLHAFLRFAGAPEDRNFISYYSDAGLTYAIDANNTAGLAFSYARASSQLQDLDHDVQLYTGKQVPVHDGELLIEATYQWQTPLAWWQLQPDVQYVFHPQAHGATPTDPSGLHPIPDALVLGLRSVITF